LITELTKEQKAKFPEYVQTWIDKGLSTYNPPRHEAEEAVKLAYRCARLDEPKKFIWCESPLHSAVCFAALRDNEDSVRASVWASVWASVRDSVWDSVWDSVGASVWGSHEASWLSFYSFMHNELGIDCSKLQGLWECTDKCGWFIPFKDTVIISPKPSICNTTYLRDRYVLHSEDEPSIYYCEDFQIFALWGVRLDKELHQKITTRTITATEVLALENIEQRMVALKYLGDNTILETLGSTLLNKQEGYELFRVNGFEQKEYALRYSCPSTKRVYVSFVEPQIGEKGDPILAVASKWKMTKDEWLSIKAHA